jgi:5,10-methylenetetrahydromethanopterin reductase
MKIGVSFSEDVPVAEQRLLARDAEAAGLASLWANDGYGRDPLLLCQAWADATERLQIGVGVAQLPTRTPVQLARAAVTVQESSSGRLLLGLGISQASTLASWHGMDRPRPLATMRDALAIIRSVMSGEQTDHDGEVLSSHRFRLAVTPLPPTTPLYLGAMGPKMLALAGAAADGVLLSWESPAAAADAAGAVRAAAAQAGRASPEIAAYVRMAVADDRGAARAALATEVAAYWPYYGEHFAGQRLGPSCVAAQAASAQGEAAVASALGDDVLLALGWYGTPDDNPAEFLAAYAGVGVDHLIARSVRVGDPIASFRRVVRALARAGGTG